MSTTNLTITLRRQAIGLTAACEIESLVQLIAQIAPQYDDAMRGLALRTKQLSGVLLSILHDEGETDQLYRDVHGVPMPDEECETV